MDGIVIVNKEKGYTSHDVVAILRGIMHTRKIGHTGTLDPDATGVLPVCLGKATKAADLIMAREKEYVTELVFGSQTDTGDAAGRIIASCEYTFNKQKAVDAIQSFIGSYEQVPPMYSAIKVGGVKLYDLAREGIEAVRTPRPVQLSEIEILDLNDKGARLRIRCSKGTYIRTLCEDIGIKTGYLAHVTSLCRTASGPFRIENSYTLDQLRALSAEGREAEAVCNLESFFSDYPAKTVLPEENRYLLNGNHLTYKDEYLPRELGAKVRLYTSDGRFIGLYAVSEVLDGQVRMTADTMFL